MHPSRGGPRRWERVEPRQGLHPLGWNRAPPEAPRPPRNKLSGMYQSLICRFFLLLILALSGSSQALGAAQNSAEDPRPAEEQQAQDGLPPIPEALRQAMMSGETSKALRQLDALIERDAEQADGWLYLKARVLAEGDRMDEALRALDRVQAEFGEGPWVHKARFFRADLLRAAGRMAEAEAIYEAEAERLLSAERQSELAEIYLRFARLLATPRDPNQPGMPEPEYGRAWTLYQKVLELEVPPAQRAEASWGIANCAEKLANWNAARGAWQVYLAEFGEKLEVTGLRALEARLQLAEVLKQLGETLPSRYALEDLVALLSDARAGEADGFAKELGRFLESADEETRKQAAEYEGRARYAIAQTYSGNGQQLALRVAALERLIQAMPEHRQVGRAHFDIAEAYREAARFEEARAAYAKMIAWEDPQGLDQETIEGNARYRQLALFRQGQMLVALGQPAEAIPVFQDYVGRYPTGAEWAEAQQATIDAEYAIGELHRSRKEWVAARIAWQGFLVKYPLDPRARRIAFDLGKMHADEARALLGEQPDAQEQALPSWRSAIDTWQRLARKYPNTNEASHALYSIGVLYENELQELEEAIHAYTQCNFGAHQHAARERLAAMTETTLAVETPRVWRSHETAQVAVQLRNTEELTVRLYRLDLQAYFRKHLTHQRIEDLDLDLIAADRTLTVAVEDYEEYKPIRQQIDLPIEEAGVWAVSVDDGERRATTLVVRSDLDMIVKSSRREFFVYVQDMVKQKPASGVEVLLALPDPAGGAPSLHVLETARDGVARLELSDLVERPELRVLAQEDGHYASDGLSVASLSLSQGLQPRGYVYPDRSAYRPGQRVHWRGVLREVVDGRFGFEAGTEYLAEVLDSEGRLVRSRRLALSEFGTVHDELILPLAAPLGTWTVRLSRPSGATYQGRFQVQEFELKTVALDIEFDQPVYYRGEVVHGVAQANYYYGEPIVDTPLHLRLPDGRELHARTDAEGRFPFQVETRDLVGSRFLQVSAALPEEGVQISAGVPVSELGYSIGLRADHTVVLAGSSFDVKLFTSDAAGEPVARDLAVEVLHRVLNAQGGWADITTTEAEVSTDERGQASLPLQLEEGGNYIVRARGLDRFGNPVVAETTLFVSGEADAQRLRILADSNTLPVGSDLDLRLVNRTESGLALLTLEGERILQYRLLELEQGVNPLSLVMDAKLAPNFRLSLALMDGNRFHTAASDFELERRLRVAVKPRQEEVQPGEEAVVDLEIVDELGNPVRAEVSLAVVDESVFAQFAEGLPSIDGYFAQDARRFVGFQTTSSCEFRYQGRTEDIAEVLLAEQRWAQASEEWERDRAVLRSELQQQMAFDAFEPVERESVRLSAGLEPSAGAYFAAPRIDPNADFASEMWNETIGIGGGAGGKFGGRAGRGRAKYANKFGLGLEEMFEMEEAAAGEMVSWIDDGLAFWTPAVVSNDEGLAELRFTMPERSTAWRLTARGVGEQDHFGEATASLISRAPFFVEMRTPRTLTEGDRPVVLARVHNLTEQDGEAELRLRILNEGFEQTLPMQVAVEAGSQAEVSFGFDAGVPLIDSLRFELEAIGRFGETELLASAADEVVVRPWGMEVADFASGVLSSESVFELSLPAGADYRDRILELSFGSDLADLVVDAAMDRASLYELRQKRIVSTQVATASRLVGATRALAMLESLGNAHPQAQALRERAESLTVALIARQNEDGGWSWSGGDGQQSEPETSARVMQALAAARTLGIPVAAQAADRGTQYLLASFQAASQRENERKAVLLYALALHGRGDFGTANRLHRLRNELSPAALAYTALALLEMDRRPMAVEIAELLATKVDGQQGASVVANRAFHRSRLEMTALAALVLQEAMPRSEATRQAMDWLLDHRPWFEDRGRGIATAAVANWVAASQPEPGDVSVIVEIDGSSMEIELKKGEFNGFSTDGIDADRVRVRLEVRGRSRPYFQATLRAFTRDLSERSHRDFRVTRHLYEAEQPLYAGRRIQTGFGVLERSGEGWHNEVSELERGGASRVNLQWYHSPRDLREESDWPYLAMRVPLPAGTHVLPDSVRGNFDRFQIRDHELVVYLGQHRGSGWMEYKLIGTVPGSYRTLPVRIDDLADPSRFALGQPAELTVLPRGRASTDDYRATPDELYHLGLAALEQGDEEMAYGLLTQLYDGFGSNLRDRNLAMAAGKLLFLAIDRGTANEVVRYFEVLKEKDPALNIPFDKVLSVGRAYRELEEYERALLIFRATIEESFGKDLKVAGTLEAQGEPSGAIGVLERLWLEFPDLPVVVETYLTLSDKLLTLAPRAHEVPGLVASKLGRAELTKAGIALLQRFLAIYHEDPLAPEAGLNLVAAFLDLEDFETGVVLAQEFSGRYAKPRFKDAFRYSEAVAQWYLGKEDNAVRTLRNIVEARYEAPDGSTKPSENRELALYILAQIHHAKRKFDEAAEYYSQVETVFADAREVLAGFRAKQIGFDEVTEVQPGKAAEIELRYRNIGEAELLVYRVDLMTLYLRERNLSQITAVNLAGIAPTQRKQVKLDSETGMREAKEQVRLKLDDPGAYLVICRGDELHTSGLVLVSDIELEVEEDLGARRLRIQALDRKKEGFVRDVDVRVVGSQGGDFVTGRTDPRGMFVAEGVAGTTTVIARYDDHHYAFFRGTRVGPPPPATPSTPSTPGQSGAPRTQGLQQLEAGDYLDNVFRFNVENQAGRAQRLSEEMQRERKGVSVGQTRAK